jgi:hypothetical protein
MADTGGRHLDHDLARPRRRFGKVDDDDVLAGLRQLCGAHQGVTNLTALP